MSKYSNNFQNTNIGNFANELKGNASQQASHQVDYLRQQFLINVIHDVNVLLFDLEKRYSQNNPDRQKLIISDAIKEISTNQNLIKNINKVLKQDGSKAVIESAIDHPAINHILKAVEGHATVISGDHYYFHGNKIQFNQQQGDRTYMEKQINQFGKGDNIGGDQILGDKIQGDKVSGDKGDKVSGNKISTQNNTSTDHTALIQDLRALLTELDQTHDKTSSTGPLLIAAEAIQTIETNKPTLKTRLTSALKKGGTAAIESAIDHPAIKPLLETAKGFVDP